MLHQYAEITGFAKSGRNCCDIFDLEVAIPRIIIALRMRRNYATGNRY